MKTPVNSVGLVNCFWNTFRKAPINLSRKTSQCRMSYISRSKTMRLILFMVSCGKQFWCHKLCQVLEILRYSFYPSIRYNLLCLIQYIMYQVCIKYIVSQLYIVTQMLFQSNHSFWHPGTFPVIAVNQESRFSPTRRQLVYFKSV